MKKKITLILFLILLFINLVGCSNTTQEAAEVEYAEETVDSNTNEFAETEKIETSDYIDCIVEENGILVVDMTLDEFIKHYNEAIDDTQEESIAAEFMKLKTEPVYLFDADEYISVYDITPHALVGGNTTISILASVDKSSQKIATINIMVPDILNGNVDISSELITTAIALTAPKNNSLSEDELYNKILDMASGLKSNGYGYYKGFYMGSYVAEGDTVYRVGAYNE